MTRRVDPGCSDRKPADWWQEGRVAAFQVTGLPWPGKFYATRCQLKMVYPGELMPAWDER